MLAYFLLIFGGIWLMVDLVLKVDGLVKSPTSALCCISQSFNVRKVRLIITKSTTPFYPERFIRGNLIFFQNRFHRIFYSSTK